MNFLCYGYGTANSELLDLLGLGSTEKDVILHLIPAGTVQKMISAIDRLMSLRSPGKGIAFSLPLYGINGLVEKVVNHTAHRELFQERGKVDELVKFCLILSVYNTGYTEEVMAAAKAAGAAGGTILHARAVTDKVSEAFHGMSILDEKEILAILAPVEMSRNIMEAINTACGPKQDPKAIVLALPVQDMVGLGGSPLL